jgi:RNA polymerase sigma factor (sigma-70 family)
VISDNELMLKVSQGDIDKIGLLYERYNKILYAYFFKLIRMQAISEDLVNDTFFKIIKYRANYRGVGKFRIWMFKIAHSVFVDNYKKNKPFVYINEYQENMINYSQNNDLSITYEKEEKKQILHNALLKLKRKEREILILSNFDNLKYKEIAEIMNCTEGAVKVRIFRAIQNLKIIYLKNQQ